MSGPRMAAPSAATADSSSVELPVDVETVVATVRLLD
jgi:hypothetical protein